MSIRFSDSKMNSINKLKLIDDITVRPKETKYNKFDSRKTKKCISILEELDPHEEKDVYLLPFAYAFSHGYLYAYNQKTFPTISCKFIGKLKPKQVPVKEEIIPILNDTKSVILKCYPGFGKTIFTIYLCVYKLKLQTLIFITRCVLIDQWCESIEKTCKNSKIQVLNSNDKVDKSADFIIMNVVNIKKFTPKEFSHIGILVCDEAHLICSEVFSECLYYIEPKYAIALTATPEKENGMDKILTLYFGANMVVRDLWHPCNVYLVKTGFVPKIEETEQGTLSWNSVLDSQADSAERNLFIIKLVKYFKHRTFLILCKLKKQCRALYSELYNTTGDDNECDIFIDTIKSYNKNCRVLISTYSKVGVGFDCPKLDALIMASDVNSQVLQYYGRIFRRTDTLPIVFDLVDNFFVLNKHWNERRQVYIRHGGQIFNFHEEFPEFKKYCNKTNQYAKIVYKRD